MCVWELVDLWVEREKDIHRGRERRGVLKGGGGGGREKGRRMDDVCLPTVLGVCV